MATAKNDALKNATPEIILADDYLDRIRKANANGAIREGIKALGRATSGDIGYETARVVTKEVSLTLAELAAWQPSSQENAIEKAVVSAQNDVSDLNKAPRYHQLLSSALLVAVCATTDTQRVGDKDVNVATIARIGKGTEKSPQYGAVRARVFTPLGTPKANAFEGNAARAAEVLTEKLKTVKDADELTVWKMASAAVNNIPELRTMGALVASVGVNVGRYRNWLFTGICQPAIDQYVTEDHLTTVGRVWLPVLAAARRAHGMIVAKAGKDGETVTEQLLNDGYPTATPTPILGIEAAVQAALEPHRGVKGKKILEGEDEKKAVREALYRALQKADDLWTGYNLRKLVNFHVGQKDDRMFAEDGLYDPKDKDMVARYQRLTGIGTTVKDQIAADVDEEEDTASKAKTARRAAIAAKQETPTPPAKTGNKPEPKTDAARLAKLSKIK